MRGPGGVATFLTPTLESGEVGDDNLEAPSKMRKVTMYYIL